MKKKIGFRELKIGKREHSKNDAGEYVFTFATDEVVDKGYYKEGLIIEGADLSRLKNNAQVLFNHDRNDYVGVITDAWVENGKGMCSVKMGDNDRAKVIDADIASGILNKVSVGYIVREELHNKEDDTFYATKWQPYEISVVTIPADDNAEIRCEMRHGISLIEFNQRREVMPKDTKETKPETKKVETTKTDEAQQNLERQMKDERSRVSAITKSARKLNISDEMVERAIVDGTSVNDFLANQENVVPETPAPTSPQILGRKGDVSSRDDEDAAGFSIVRAIADAAIFQKVTGRNHKASRSFEMMSQSGGDLSLPTGLMAREDEAKRWEQRNLTAANATSLISTNVLSILQSLQNSIILGSLGAKMYLGLTENQVISVSNTTGDAAYTASGTKGPTQNEIYVARTLNPRRIAINTKLDKQIMINTSQAIQADATNDLFQAIGRGIQKGAFSGDGTGVNPTGIINTAGVATVAGDTIFAAPSKKNLSIAETKTRTANVPQMGGAWVMSSAAFATLTTTLLSAGAAEHLAQYGMEEGMNLPTGKTCTGRKVFTTNEFADSGAGAAIYGQWAQLACGMWENLTINVDANSQAVTELGQIGIVVETFADSVILRPQGFVTTTA